MTSCTLLQYKNRGLTQLSWSTLRDNGGFTLPLTLSSVKLVEEHVSWPRHPRLLKKKHKQVTIRSLFTTNLETLLNARGISGVSITKSLNCLNVIPMQTLSLPKTNGGKHDSAFNRTMTKSKKMTYLSHAIMATVPKCSYAAASTPITLIRAKENAVTNENVVTAVIADNE